MKKYELRVGVCECIPGAFELQQVLSSTKVALAGRELSTVPVLIGEGDHLSFLSRHRCHFFVDTFLEPNNSLYTALVRIYSRRVTKPDESKFPGHWMVFYEIGFPRHCDHTVCWQQEDMTPDAGQVISAMGRLLLGLLHPFEEHSWLQGFVEEPPAGEPVLPGPEGLVLEA